MKRFMIAFAVSFIFACDPLYACSICGCGDPMESAGSGLVHQGTWKLGLEWEALSSRAASPEDSSRMESMDQTILRAALAWQATEKLGLLFRLPYNLKHAQAWGGADENEDHYVGGLGDAELGIQWTFASDIDLSARKARWASVSLGSSLNTGASDVSRDGVRIDEHEQPGTGAVGPFVGLRFGGEQGEWGHWLYTQYQAHATNGSGYRYGNVVRAGLGVNREHANFLSVGVSLEGRYADYDRDDSQAILIENTGGTALHLVPSMGMKFGPSLGATFKAQLPLHTNLFGEQTLSPTFAASTQYLF